MSGNLFLTALNNHEANLFFRGDGPYFALNRENGGHSYYVHMSGWVVNYVDGDDLRMRLFSDAFKKFIDECSPAREEDLYCILENTTGYIMMRDRKLFPESAMLVSEYDEVFQSLKDFLVSLKKQPFFDRKKLDLENYSEFIRARGASLLADLLVA